jgi:hypothetical protein
MSSPFGEGQLLSLGKRMLEAFGRLTTTTIGGRRLGQGLNKPCQVSQGKSLTRTGPASYFPQLSHVDLLTNIGQPRRYC